MRNTALSLLSAIVLCLSLGGASLHASTLQVYTSVLPPFSNGEGAEKPGITHEIVLEMAKRANIDVSVSYMPWPRALKGAETEANVMIIPPVRSPARENQFNWVSELVTSNMVFVSVGETIKSLEEARSLKKVAVLRSSVMEKILTKMEFTNLHSVPDGETAVKMVNAGRIDAFFCIDLEIFGIFEAAGLDPSGFQVSDSIIAAKHWLAANHNFDPQTAEALNSAFETMLEDGSVTRIITSYTQ